MAGTEFPSVFLLLITSFIGLLSFVRSDTDGFINIRCGANGNMTDDNSQLWISDSPFIKADRSVSMVHSISSTFNVTLAFFPNMAVKKYCYMIPVEPHRNYLVRATFAPDSTTPWPRFFDLLIEGIKWRSLDLSHLDNATNSHYEIILAAKTENLSLCLARNTQTEKVRFVFISSIELRPLESSMYNSTDFQKQAMSLVDRIDHGTSSKLKFSDDPFDLKWSPIQAAVNAENKVFEDELPNELSIGSELVNRPPATVLRTAIAPKGIVENMWLFDEFVPFSDPGDYYFALYFCNLDLTGFPRVFTAYINGIQLPSLIKLSNMRCWQADYDLKLETSVTINITLKPVEALINGVKLYGWELGPIINGGEMYRKLDVKTTTSSGDVVAIRKIAQAINVPDDWTGGDPCLPADYSSTGITCSQDDPPRVIIIDLTSMNLEGTIPSNIADLTALQRLLLGNNKFSGHIPDLSSLKNLTILQLQNNQLTGDIPRSLEKLQKLNQLF